MTDKKMISYIPCTVCSGCTKCLRECPVGINIPDVLKIYADYRAGDTQTLEKLSQTLSQGEPIDCIECGVCSARCPKGIDVQKIMRELAMMQSCGRLMLLEHMEI